MAPAYEDSPVSRIEFERDLAAMVSRLEFKQVIDGLQNMMQLAVVEGVKQALPAILEKIDDKYGDKVKSMHTTLYDGENGLVLVVDRISQLIKELPALIRMKWQLFGIVLSSNIIAVCIGWWAATSFTTPKMQYIVSTPAPVAERVPAAHPRP